MNEPISFEFLLKFFPLFLVLHYIISEKFLHLGGKNSQKSSSVTELKDYFPLSIIQKKLIIFRELGEFAMTSQPEFIEAS